MHILFMVCAPILRTDIAGDLDKTFGLITVRYVCLPKKYCDGSMVGVESIYFKLSFVYIYIYI